MANSRYDPLEGKFDMDDSPVGEHYEDDDALDLEKPTKYGSKDRKRSSGVREDKEHRSGKEREEKEPRDLEKDRVPSRDKKRDDRDDRDKEKSKDGKGKDRDYDREKHRDKERKDRGRERGLEEKDNDRERDKEKGKEKSRERDRERHKVKEKEKENDKEKHKEREKVKESYRDGEKEKGKEKVREREREIDQDKERSKGSHHAEDGSNYEASMQYPSASDIEKRILKMKEARLNKESEDASETLSWITKIRKLEEKKNFEKEKAKQLSKLFEEQDNVIHEESEDEDEYPMTTNNLAGVKVLHGLDRVVEGGAVVLTLKDQNILANGDINEEIDMLENVEIGEQKRRDEAYKASKKKSGTYDDKFNDDPHLEKKILPQYDEPATDEGFTLDEKGRISGEAEKKLQELRQRLEGVSSRPYVEDLNSSSKVSSDYYTQEEMLRFKKPKKKKSLRKKEKLDIDALEAEARSSGLGAGDLGSRNDKTRQAIKKEKEKSETEMRNNAYQTALAKAEEASKLLRLEQTLTVHMEEDETPSFVADDYDDLSKSLERARRLALSKKTEEVASGPQAVALLAASNPNSQMPEELTTPASGEAQENKVVFTEMEEFVWGLQIDEEAHKPKGEDVFMQEDEDMDSFVEGKKEDGGGAEVKETEDGEQVDKNEEVIVPDETIHESTLGKGLSGALKLLKDRGTLKETIDWGGRNMDKKKSKLVGILEDGEQKEIKKEIRIERTDEFGRILTPKEAFRLLSHKFHGKGPGKMKLEKRQKQFQEELKMKQMKSTDTPSLSVERMRETQARLKTPYLVLSGHVKPGQTSDPKSGFATVEKDFSGGLTPMLGDQKVEHFLGIKRKGDSSNSSLSKKHKP